MFVAPGVGPSARQLVAEADRRHDAVMLRQQEQSARVLRETQSRAESYHQNEMSTAAQNFASLQAVTQQLRQELMSQTRELQENKLRFVRHESQAAEEREAANREFKNNKDESLNFLRELFSKELAARDKKHEDKIESLTAHFESRVESLFEQNNVLREKLEEEKARSSRSRVTTPRSNVYDFANDVPPGFEEKAPPQVASAPEQPWNPNPKTIPTPFSGSVSELRRTCNKDHCGRTGRPCAG